MLRALIFDIDYELKQPPLISLQPVIHLLRKFRTAGGEDLNACLVSRIAEIEDSQSQSGSLPDRLELFGLRSEFQPLSERVTAFNETLLNAKALFEDALQKLDDSHRLSNCILVSSSTSLFEYCNTVGIQILHVNATGSVEEGWTSLLSLIANQIGNKDNDMYVFVGETAQKFEFGEIVLRELSDTMYDLTGIVYRKVTDCKLAELNGLHLPFPAKLEFKHLKDNSTVIDSKTLPNEGNVEEAIQHVISLVAKGEIELAGFEINADSNNNSMHRFAPSQKTFSIAKDSLGRRILKRNFFS
jgi:hypothetical protein